MIKRAGLFGFLMVFAVAAHAVPLDTDILTSRNFRGTSADNPSVQCHFETGETRRSPANKFTRKNKFGINGVTWPFLDFDPKQKIALSHYNQQGWYGYDIHFRSYTNDSPSVRIWMNYMVNKRVPASIQVFSTSKKTGLTRLLAECTNLR